MSDYLHHFPKPFLEDVVQGRCLPFVGAGFSLNAKTPPGTRMPDWEALGRQVASAMPDYQYTTALEALSAYAHEYSRAKLVEMLGAALCVNTAQPGPAHEAFCQLPFERVVTTNFDFLVERTYASLSRYCLPLIAEEQLAVAVAPAGVRLLKLHGDLHHPNRLVATEDDYDAFLARYPLLSTHLSSLLIENTALFLGYSLDDPDFRQIWQIVKDRLGQLRRPAYVVQVGAPPHVAARYERRGVKVINLPGSPTRSYGEILEIAFREIRDFWTGELLTRSTATETEPQAELSLPTEARGRMCFFSVPTRLAAFYKSAVYPIAENFGFTPVMAADVVAPGDNIMAKTFALIDKSAIVLADVSTPSTLLEVGMLLSKPEADQRLIVVTEPSASLPLDLAKLPIIMRQQIPSEADDAFIIAVVQRFEAIERDLAPTFEDEPRRLLEKKEYRASAISAFTVLEHELRRAIQQKEIALTSERSAPADARQYSRLTLWQMVKLATNERVISPEIFAELRSHLNTRNELVHTRRSIQSTKARKIVEDVERIVADLRKGWRLTHGCNGRASPAAEPLLR